MEELYSHQGYGVNGSLIITGTIESGLTLKMGWKEKTLLIKNDSIKKVGDLLNLSCVNGGNIFLVNKKNIGELATELGEHVRNFSFNETPGDGTISHKLLSLLDDNGYNEIKEIKN